MSQRFLPWRKSRSVQRALEDEAGIARSERSIGSAPCGHIKISKGGPPHPLIVLLVSLYLTLLEFLVFLDFL